jgi:hypothetical protein
MDRPGDVADLLRFLIRRLDEELESGEAALAAPLLLRLDGADVATAVGGVDLHVKPFEGHPTEVLTGFTAPPEWFGVGVLTTGWVHRPGTERTRMRATSFMCRDGAELAAFRAVGEELDFLESRSEGPMADTLRRVVGLPTSPPDVLIDEWLAKCWLQIIVKRTKRGKRAAKLAWRETAALHPAIGVTGARPDQLARVAPSTAEEMTWERFRQLQADGGDATAAWMDDGMFARWMVHGYPPMSRKQSTSPRRSRRPKALRVRRALQAPQAERPRAPRPPPPARPSAGSA